MIAVASSNGTLTRDCLLGSSWFMVILVINRETSLHVMSILPYLAPVILITVRYGMVAGFLFSALGTAVSVPPGFLNDHTVREFNWGLFTTFLKLSCASAGVEIGQRIVAHRNDPNNH